MSYKGVATYGYGPNSSCAIFNTFESIIKLSEILAISIAAASTEKCEKMHKLNVYSVIINNFRILEIFSPVLQLRTIALLDG